jgi:nucleotide-binding universal stress UspA family protein
MFKRLLIVVDPRPAVRAAVVEGVALAKAHNAEVVFFHVLPQYPVQVADATLWAPMSEADFRHSASAAADRLFAAAAAVAEKVGVMYRTAAGNDRDEAQCIVEAARKRRCDLIVVASEGRNAVLRLLTGSIIPALITTAPMPVMVVKQRRAAIATGSAEVVPLRPRAAKNARAGG